MGYVVFYGFFGHGIKLHKSSLYLTTTLEDYNCIETNKLPFPATYIIDNDGIIRYAFVDTNYRKRAEPEDLMNVLKNYIIHWNLYDKKN